MAMISGDVVLARGLLRILADTFVLLYKARHAVWHTHDATHVEPVPNVFRNDHQALNASGDALAALILELGGGIPPSYEGLIRFSSLDEDRAAPGTADRFERIAADHGRIAADIDMLLLLIGTAPHAGAQALLTSLRDQHERCARSIRDAATAPDEPQPS